MIALEDIPPFQIWNEVCKQVHIVNGFKSRFAGILISVRFSVYISCPSALTLSNLKQLTNHCLRTLQEF